MIGIFGALGAKLIVAGALAAALGIGVHAAIGAWRTDIAEREGLRIANGRAQSELAKSREQLRLLEESHAAAKRDAEWARDYAASREAELAQLRKNSSGEAAECLDTEIDSSFLR